MTRDFIDAHDVAAILEIGSAAAFLRQRDRLERDEAFPVPVPTQLRPLKWRRDAVEAWKAAQGHPRARAAETDRARFAPNVILMSEAART